MGARRAVVLLLVVACCMLGVGPAMAAKAAKGKERTLSLPVARSMAKLAAAPVDDVTGDGLADAVVRDRGPDSGTFRLFTHNGASTGNPWPSFASAGGEWDFADALLLGDVNGDGRTDVVARDPAVGNGTLWIYPHNGATSGNPWTTRFTAGTRWNQHGALMLGDVTGDGRLDLVTREQGVASGTLWIYPHSGATVTNPWTVPRVWAGTGWNLANVMMLADANGDGRPEPVIRDGSGAVWIYPHNGTTSGNPYTSRYFAGSGWELAKTLLIADATGDGWADLLAIDSAGDLSIYPHNGAATGNPYTVARRPAGGGWTFASTFVVGDVSGDGKPDLLARLRAGDLWVYPNGGGASPWESRFSAGSRWTFENQLLLGDLTGDGRPEVVARDPGDGDGALWIYPNNGSTTSDPWTGPRVFAGTGWNLAVELVLGDLTGDGWQDILLRDMAGDLWIYPHSGTTNGNPWTMSRRWAGSGWDTAAAVTIGDVNGDGAADLVDAERDGSMWIYLTGSSAAPIRVAGDWRSTRAFGLADVGGTGRLDLVARDDAGDLWVYAHNGSTSSNPWTVRRQVGTGWGFATSLLF